MWKKEYHYLTNGTFESTGLLMKQQMVLASIEDLQIEGLANTIEVWRLPVGHTHEVNHNILVLNPNID